MKIVAVMGSYRKGRTIDTLVDRAIEGVKNADPEAEIEKTTLIDRNIEYCRNCGVCRNDDPAKPIGKCAIDDQDVLGTHLLDPCPGRTVAGSRVSSASNGYSQASDRDPQHRAHHPAAAEVLR